MEFNVIEINLLVRIFVLIGVCILLKLFYQFFMFCDELIREVKKEIRLRKEKKKDDGKNDSTKSGKTE